MERIGWIGTGVMGVSMCGHLLDAGYKTCIYNRTKHKAASLLGKGAVWCDNPADVARNSDVVFTIVGYPQDVELTYFGDTGVFTGSREGMLLVDMTTSKPELAERIAIKSAEWGVESLDAPVSGGDVGARQATLSIMVGGSEAAFQRAQPMFEKMGKSIARMGGAGAGQHTKMCNQIQIAGSMVGMVESLSYAYKAGLDLQAVINAIGKGAAGCWSINNLGPRIAKGDLEPGFYIKHFVKDMGIALDEAARMNLALPGLALVHQFYVAAKAMGLEDKGTQALWEVFRRMDGAKPA